MDEDARVIECQKEIRRLRGIVKEYCENNTPVFPFEQGEEVCYIKKGEYISPVDGGHVIGDEAGKMIIVREVFKPEINQK